MTTTNLKNELPPLHSFWRHKNGNNYKVIMIANEASENLNEYPITIVYQGDNGKIWSRSFQRWHGSMTRINYTPPYRGQVV